MASGSVSVRLPEEVLERLEKLAAERKEKVSDVVRALIIAGLDRKDGSGEDEAHKKAVTDYLEGIADILTALLHETVGARYFAEMGLSYSTDVESLLREQQPLAKEAKDRLVNRGIICHEFRGIICRTFRGIICQSLQPYVVSTTQQAV